MLQAATQNYLVHYTAPEQAPNSESLQGSDRPFHIADSTIFHERMFALSETVSTCEVRPFQIQISQFLKEIGKGYSQHLKKQMLKLQKKSEEENKSNKVGFTYMDRPHLTESNVENSNTQKKEKKTTQT
ncbi:unnamed protein product [Auanema sp. JU1783]|nr:unnamed protein product [Auanema sp. JU1783]